MAATGQLQLEPFDPDSDSGSRTEWEERLHFVLESSGISDSRSDHEHADPVDRITDTRVQSIGSRTHGSSRSDHGHADPIARPPLVESAAPGPRVLLVGTAESGSSRGDCADVAAGAIAPRRCLPNS